MNHPLTLQMIADTIGCYPEYVFLDEEWLDRFIPVETSEFCLWMSDFYYMTSGYNLDDNNVMKILGFEMEYPVKEYRDGKPFRLRGKQYMVVDGIIDFARMFYDKGAKR